MGYVRDKEREIERAVTIVKVWNVLSVVVFVFQIAIHILYLIGVLKTVKIVLFALGLLPWVRYIYALIFPNAAVWDEFDKSRSAHSFKQSAESRVTHFYFIERWSRGIQSGILLFDIKIIFLSVQEYKGLSKILMMCALIFVVMMIVGFFRIKGRDKLRQMLVYGIIMACFVSLTVNTTCFFLSSPAQHEACSYISKNKSSNSKGGTYYYVTVELENGDTYKSLVSYKLYKRAENAELVACHNEGPWGIEYLRVHEAK